jgi:hypothetical protein
MDPPTEEPVLDTTDPHLNEAEPGLMAIPETPIVVPEEVILAEVDTLSGQTEPLDVEPEVVASRGGPGLRGVTGGNPEERGDPEVTSTFVRGDQGSEARGAARRAASTLTGFERPSPAKLTRARSI